MQDFSRTESLKPPLEFEADGDTFYAIGDVPGGVISDLAAIVDDKNDAKKLSTVVSFLDDVLLPESATLFAERMRSQERPITFTQVLAIFEWLVEVYMKDVGTPTQPRSSSRNGRGGIEPSSTARVLGMAGGRPTPASAE